MARGKEDDLVLTEEVFKQLQCTREGLSSAVGERRLEEYGPNKIEQKKKSILLNFLYSMWNPLSWMLEVAAIVVIAGSAPNWQVSLGTVMFLVFNATVSFTVENDAGNAAASVMANLALKTKLLRNGTWIHEDASILVPGDIISIKLGDIFPADVRLLEGDQLTIDQSAITNECHQVTKKPQENLFTVVPPAKRGELEAVVYATGIHTDFGKAGDLVHSINQVGHFQWVNFCTCSIANGLVVEIIIMYAVQKRKYKDGIDNLLFILIGGIPIAMPTVLSRTMVIGWHRLTQQGAVTKRIAAIDEMAGMDVLCFDETGTLTLDKLSVEKNLIEVFTEGVDKDHVLLLEARASRTENQMLLMLE